MENVALDRGILGHKHHEDVLFWCVDIRGPGLLVPKTECCAEKTCLGWTSQLFFANSGVGTVTCWNQHMFELFSSIFHLLIWDLASCARLPLSVGERFIEQFDGCATARKDWHE